MDSIKCRAHKRLSAGLFLLEARTGAVLKVWYEDDWDVMATKDLIQEEVLAYRQNPKSYIESQIGIR